MTLTEQERTALRASLNKGETRRGAYTRTHILLLADETDASDPEIARVLHISADTVQRTRQRFVEGGVERVLHDKRRPGACVKLTPEQER